MKHSEHRENLTPSQTPLQRDFERLYQHTGYDGRIRKALAVLTAPGFQAVWSYRVTRWLWDRHIPVLGAIIQRLTEVWAGISIPPEVTIGPGLLIHHSGGIVLNGRAVLGRDCTLHHGVTIGNRISGGPSPTLGDRVMVGVGAAILGNILIGDDAEIGANAVVLDHVPAGGVAVGVPARVARIKGPA